MGMRIFDSVHGLIPFEDNDAKALQEIIDTPAFQRLRRIRQLGFADLVYPGATHTRFAHSVGVFKNARDMLNIVRQQSGGKYKKRQAQITSIAALLHDVGHGPFSHSFEGAVKTIDKKFDENAGGDETPLHEKWSERIVREDEDVKKALEAIDEKIGGEIAGFLQDINQKKRSDLYTEIVSSQFDADRMDYLQRDARATGIDIGNFDRDWLMDCLRIDDGKDKPNWVVGSKGRQAVEAYLLARVQLQESIYFHPTNCGFNIIFQKLLEELNDTLRVKENGDSLPSGVRDNPVATYLKERARVGKTGWAADKEVKISTYLAMDDAAAWTLVNTLATREKEDELHRLARRLTSRRSLPFVKLEPLDPKHPLKEMKNKLAEFRGEIKNQFSLDEWQYDAKPLNIYYSGGKEHPDVLIRTPDEKESRPLGESSSLIRGLESRAFFYYCRVYFDAKEDRDRLASELRQVASDFRAEKSGRVKGEHRPDVSLSG
ncbi:MAG: HD domain-containing protein [Alphaproteobacteria bacterium]|nr:HD domain-containing protein [Alphaproteobacteria bacterium]